MNSSLTDTLQLPAAFTPSRLAPTMDELAWLNQWLRTNVSKCKNVLEFGCGVTTWAIHSALSPSRYVAVEVWPQCITDTQQHLPAVEIVTTTWHDIPVLPYNVVFVDSSAGNLHGKDGLFRDQAVQFAESFQANDAYVILHDWHKRSGKKPRLYLEQNQYDLVAFYRSRSGIGIYQRCS